MDNKSTINNVIFGNNIDKKMMDTTNKRISKDRDILRLIFYSKVRMLILIAVALFTLYGAGKDVTEGILDYCKRLNFQSSWDMLVSIIVIVIIIIAVYLDFKSLSEESMNLRNYIKYIFKGSMNPHTYWSVNTGSVSDTQISAALVRTFDKKINIYFTGEPYFQIKPIDSIYIKIHGLDKRRRFQLKRLYRKCLHRFYVNTYIGNADDNYFEKNNRKLQVSNSTFGILFLSQFLYKMYEKLFDNKETKDEIRKINLWCSEQCCGVNKEFIETLLKSSTSPKYFKWVDSNDINLESKEISIEICDISYLDDKEIRRRTSNSFIRIPIKRYVGIPKNLLHKNMDMNLLNRVLIPGGAEQNLALQYIINQYIWEEKGENKEVPRIKLGFAENSFFDYRETDFLIGTEGLVYGVTEDIRGRIFQEFKHLSEVIYFEYKGIQFISIYGYSAIATKMSVVVFGYKLMEYNGADEEVKKEARKYIPGLHIARKSILTYKPVWSYNKNKDGRDNNTTMLDEWDKGVINSKSGLDNWYKDYKEAFEIGD